MEYNEDVLEQAMEVTNSDYISGAIGSFVESEFHLAETQRSQHEQRWMRSFNQFRGNYSQEELNQLRALKEKNPFASEAFIKITKTKTLTAIGSLYEVLTAGNRVPISVEATPEPEGIAKKIHISLTKDDPDNIKVDGYTDVDNLASTIGFAGDGKEIPRGATFKDMFSGLGDKYTKLFKNGTLIQEGDSPDPVNAVEIHPAKEAAARMNSVMQDQLLQSDVIKCFEGALWEVGVFGTGVIKGPFTYKELLPKWTENEETGELEYTPAVKLRPYFQQPSLWNVYPDSYAETQDDLDFVIERHKMSKAQLGKLRNQVGFDKEQIELAMRESTGIEYEEWELQLKDSGQDIAQDSRYKVLEFWGNIDADKAKEWKIEGLNPDLKDFDRVPVCLWVVGGRCVKKQLNPFTPERIPYVFPTYEEQPYQIWGVGVPENMEDAQAMINVHTRAAQDNLRLAGSCMLEVNENQLAPNQDNSIFAGKVWRKQGGGPGQSVYSINFNNTAPQHLQFIQSANQWADQSSGIPSILHGQTGVSSVGRTAFGLSALMDSGNLSIRTVVKNLDRDMLKPLGQALFNWNMQFNTEDRDIRGDLRIVAKGSAALAMKEVQSQRLLSFLQIASNPLVAPFVNVPNVLKDLAISLELDPNDMINDPTMAKLYAEIIGEQANVNFQNGTGTPQESGQGQPPTGGEPGGATDPNFNPGVGNGNIGIGTPGLAGEAPTA